MFCVFFPGSQQVNPQCAAALEAFAGAAVCLEEAAGFRQPRAYRRSPSGRRYAHTAPVSRSFLAFIRRGCWEKGCYVGTSDTGKLGAPLAPPTLSDTSEQTFSTCGLRPFCGPRRRWKWPVNLLYSFSYKILDV